MTPTLPNALTVLSAMITPAVLLSACSSLIIATTGRLNRAVDRTRVLSREFSELDADDEAVQRQRRMLFLQLDYSTTRSRLLQRALSGLYYAVCAFVGTSLAIAAVTIGGHGFALPIGIGVGGCGFLLYASLVLVREARIALSALQAEMDYVWAEGRARASDELLELSGRRPKPRTT